ncbi:hypothetical protein BCR34DRAFT_612624 [Clohesyomyces aquaticus]|uniref:Uncharacterized protein n=1 Tax=Clohesyomyces aquaticus TaxID=1231657 RepID=A0A1Y1ZWL8_9PLEO|nr:hypothetical protein BCR34DRAFT_612624 [Clohesyomyces aquaticus]
MRNALEEGKFCASSGLQCTVIDSAQGRPPFLIERFHLRYRRRVHHQATHLLKWKKWENDYNLAVEISTALDRGLYNSSQFGHLGFGVPLVKYLKHLNFYVSKKLVLKGVVASILMRLNELLKANIPQLIPPVFQTAWAPIRFTPTRIAIPKLEGIPLPVAPKNPFDTDPSMSVAHYTFIQNQRFSDLWKFHLANQGPTREYQMVERNNSVCRQAPGIYDPITGTIQGPPHCEGYFESWKVMETQKKQRARILLKSAVSKWNMKTSRHLVQSLKRVLKRTMARWYARQQKSIPFPDLNPRWVQKMSRRTPSPFREDSSSPADITLSPRKTEKFPLSNMVLQAYHADTRNCIFSVVRLAGMPKLPDSAIQPSSTSSQPQAETSKQQNMARKPKLSRTSKKVDIARGAKRPRLSTNDNPSSREQDNVQPTTTRDPQEDSHDQTGVNGSSKQYPRGLHANEPWRLTRQQFQVEKAELASDNRKLQKIKKASVGN